MDRWINPGTMKRKLNENASDTDKEKGHSRPGAAFKQRFFSPDADSKMITVFCVV